MWSIDLRSSGCNWLPAYAKGVTYTSGPGVACALDAATGHVLWSTPLFAAHSFLPAIANGVVYLYGDADLFAIDASNGQILAIVNVPGVPQIGQRAVANGFVYVTGSNGRLCTYGLLQRCVALPCP